jgi:putative nucleotidyltransferase with HDIG domain
MKCVLGSNHFLSKPCEPETVKKAIERAITLDQWLNNESMKSLVMKIRTFPSIPSLYFEVLTELRSSDASAERVGEIISKDLAMSTKVLQVLNSAYYAIPRQITDPTEAVNMLGFEMVKSLVLCIQVFAQFDKVKPVYFSIDKLWRHSTDVAQAARQIARFENLGAEFGDEVYTAGLLHDIGKLVLVSNFSEHYGQVLERAAKDKVPLCDVEKETFGASHAQIGAYLIGLWGMPLSMAEAACFHHGPKRLGTTAINVVALVHAANAILTETSSDDSTLDEVFLERSGFGGRAMAWRGLIRAKADSRPSETVSSKNAQAQAPRSSVPTPEQDELPRWVLPLALGGAILLSTLAVLRALKVF